MGCTEPLAIAYAAAMAREVLGEIPEKVLVKASDNIIKNVKSVKLSMIRKNHVNMEQYVETVVKIIINLIVMNGKKEMLND